MRPSIDAFQDELLKIAGLGNWFKRQYNAAGSAIGQAMVDQGRVVDSFGRPDLPIVGAAKHFISGKIPTATEAKVVGPVSKAFGKLDKIPGWGAVRRTGQAAASRSSELLGLAKIAEVVPYQQETEYTCSAACLKAVMAGYGLDIPEEQVAQAIGTSPGRGAECDEIVLGAHSFGLDAFEHGFASLEQAKFILDQDIPIICDIQSFNHPGKGHYVVMTAIDDAGVHLMDPNTPGNIRILIAQEMEERWWDRAMQPPHKLMPKHGIVVLPPGEEQGAQQI